MTTMTPTPLPIELWNIILTFAPHTFAKQFIYLSMVHKIFNPTELEVLKTKYIYDYLICSNPLNKHIYQIYHSIETIDSNIKYITQCSHIYKYCMSNKIHELVNSLSLKNYLLNKIENNKHKTKFNNITRMVKSDYNSVDVNYLHTLKYL